MPPARILLVDDNATARTSIRKVLEEMSGLEVVSEVGSSLDLQSNLADHQPDCMLIDISMLESNAISAIRGIQSEHPKLKILVVTAIKDVVYVQGLLEVGVNGYYLKDQPLKELQLAVQRVLAGEIWLSSPLISLLIQQREVLTPLPHLTARQQELLFLLTQGLDNKTIALKTGLCVKTIENHLTRLYRLLHVQSRLAAVNYVIQYPQVLGVAGKNAVQAARVSSLAPDTR